MLKIRLARIGKKKKPTYRFVVSDSQKDLYGRALEILGHYNPFSKVIEVKKDRILYWISQGAQLSPTVHNLFVDQNVISKEKVKASKGKKKKAEVGEKKAEKPAEAAAVPEEKPAEGDTAPKEKKEEKPAEEKPKKEAKVEEKTEEKKEEKK